MADTNFSSNNPMPSRIRTNGDAIPRAAPPVHAEDGTAVDPDLMPRSRKTLKSGQGEPTRQQHSMELVQGAKPPGPAYDTLLTPDQVAERLNVSPDWVRDHSSRKTPRLPVIRLGGGPGRAGLLRYRVSDVERFIDEMARLSERRSRAV